ncbi:hypothetical protein H5410_014727 [Solanum commersonii]|uniref:Uncharacterized protein n=1 Tax=Solanum commersonii TaxID=4109 RepID=A0A9J5ZSB2_SOLCO|nr:hypothetical protein H5410_014727 [Solanum commersonii]
MSPGRSRTYPRMMSAGLGCCRMSLVDVVYSMCTYHVRCVLALAGDACHWLTLLARCAHAISDVSIPWLLPLAIGQC